MSEALPDAAPLRLPDPCLVVLVGATGSGKTQWASSWFEPDQIVSSDRLRAMVGTGERDQRASRDAFELLDLIVEKRVRRRLTTVVDTTGLEDKRRAGWLPPPPPPPGRGGPPGGCPPPPPHRAGPPPP